jgi:fido (protein-threonine AMPylation protein)
MSLRDDNLRDSKMAVLRQLGEEAEPISMPDLLQKLDRNFKERSVRRWLQLLIEEGSVQTIGKKRGAKYIAIGRVQEQKNDISSCFSSASLRVIEMIKKPSFQRKPVAYADDWFDNYQPTIDFYLDTKIRSLLYKSGRRVNAHDPAGTYAHQIFNRLLIDLSYNSSRLEGNTYSLLDTERLLLHGDSPEGKLDEEKIMILNHKEAIRYLVDNAPKLEINQNVICTLHYLLSDGLIDPSDAGKVRRHGVRIGGSVYIPFEDPKRLEMQLERILAKATLIKDPFEQSIFLLIHISYLQVFADVNKRTARLSANIPLIKGNLVPLAFNDVEKEDYISAMLAVYELQDVRPLVDLYVYSYMRTCAAYDSTVKSMGFDEVRVRYRQQRRNVVREVILKRLIENNIRVFVEKEALNLVPEAARSFFIEDVMQDLQQMDESRLVGLGVSPEELAEWRNKDK